MQVIEGYRDGWRELAHGRFHYLEWGDSAAPAMVLLHGLTGHAHIWDHMGPELAASFRVIALDQRGHGDSPHTATYATADFVGDAEAFRAGLGVDRFVLMGLSMGGHNAMAYALAHPDHVERLIVIDIPPRLDPDRWPNRAERERRAEEGHPPFADLDAAVDAVRPEHQTAPEDNLRYRTHWNLRETDAGLMLKWDARVPVRWEPADLTAGLSQLAMPTLLVRGGLSDTLPRAVAEKMVAAIPDGELVQIDASGHSVPTDRPEDLTPVVLEWLSRRAGG